MVSVNEYMLYLGSGYLKLAKGTHHDLGDNIISSGVVTAPILVYFIELCTITDEYP